MSPSRITRHFVVSLSRAARRHLLTPSSLGVRLFHVLIVLSMLLPNFIGFVRVVAAAEAEAPTPSPTATLPAADEPVAAPAFTAALTASPTATGTPSPSPTVTPLPTSTATFAPTLTPTVSTTSVANGEVFDVGVGGGEIEAMGGRVRVIFPAGALMEPVRVQVGVPADAENLPFTLSGRPFSITASGMDSGQIVSQFQTFITIEIEYDERTIGGAETGLTLFYFDETLRTWVPLSSMVDAENNVLTALTNHFSDFDLDVQSWQSARTPTMDNFQVSLYTGAATYALPLWVPPGPGGLQPSLTLSYNSQVVDSATARTQASWVGMGWSLETGYIERNMNGTMDYDGDDTFMLVVNGVSSMLLPAMDGYYHTTDETFWRIKYDTANDEWTVWDKTGNVYIFGDQTASPQDDRGKYPVYDPSDCGYLGDETWHWPLVTVRNIFSQELDYLYAKESKDTKCDSSQSGRQTADLAIYPAEIRYPHDRYRVVFVRDSQLRADYDPAWDSITSRVFFKRSRLKEVQMWHDTSGSGGWLTVRKYTFTYETSASNLIFPQLSWPGTSGKTLTLKQVQEFGFNGVNALPGTTFTYGDSMHLTSAENGHGGRVEFDYGIWYAADGPNSQAAVQDIDGGECKDGGDDNYNPNPGWSAVVNTITDVHCRYRKIAIERDGGGGALEIKSRLAIGRVRPGRAYLLHLANAQATGGGSIQYGLDDGSRTTYASAIPVTAGGVNNVQSMIVLPMDATQAQVRIVCVAGGVERCELLDEFRAEPLVTRYRVTEKRLYASASGTPVTFTYNYGTGAVNGPVTSPDAGTSNPYVEPFSEFRGHSWVEEITPDGGKTKTWFNQGDQTKGRSSKMEARDGANKLFRVVDPTWSTVDYTGSIAGMPTKENGPDYTGLHIYWVYKTAEEVWACDGASNCVKRRTVYEHFAPDQGNTQFGNLTRIREQSWNGSDWDDYRATRSWYYPNISNTIYLVGLPAATSQYKCPGTGSGCSYTNTGVASTHFIYDGNSAWNQKPTAGKLAKTRTWMDNIGGTDRFDQVSYAYDNWGNTTSVTTYSGYGTYLAGPASGARTTTTTYDSTYHTYVLSVNPPLAGSTAFGYDYGRGLLTSVTGANGNVTQARYDDFGRLTKIARPGDSLGSPTVRISYYDTASPYFYTTVTQKIDSGTSLTVRKFYDGLGRLVQTQTANAVTGSGTKDIIGDNYYDAAGRLWKQSVPYALPPGSGYRSPQSQPYTATTYDALGRPDVVTATDGSQVNYGYALLQTSVTDANGNMSTTSYDIWGRVVQVAPPAGATLSYQYDVSAVKNTIFFAQSVDVSFII